MKRRKSKDMDDVEMDMTPMIDVVFNLIIFFMLVTQMVTIERAELELPRASNALEEEVEDKNQFIINIHEKKDKEGRWVETSLGKHSWAELSQLLYEEAQAKFDDNEDVSERQVLIRADRGTPYRMVQRVMIECSKQKIYKVSFAAKMQTED